MLLEMRTVVHDDVVEAGVAQAGVTKSQSRSSVASSRSELRFASRPLRRQVVAKELPQTHGLGDRHRNSEPRIPICGGSRVARAAELETKTAAGISGDNRLPLRGNRNIAHSRSVRSLELARFVSTTSRGRPPSVSARYGQLPHPLCRRTAARRSSTGWHPAGGTLNVCRSQLGSRRASPRHRALRRCEALSTDHRRSR
jgi:hypothetical protein